MSRTIYSTSASRSTSGTTVALVTVAVVATAAGSTWAFLWLSKRREEWESQTAKDERKRFQDSVAKTMVGPNPLLISTQISNNQALPNSADDHTSTKMLTTHYKCPQRNKRRGTIVLIHGFGCTSMEFTALRQLLIQQQEQAGGESMDIFGYDRVLFVQENNSDSQSSRDATTLAQELHALLENRHMAPPFLLVGHSYGGLIAQHYCHLYPSQIMGMVLLDPAHERQFTTFPWDFATEFTHLIPHVLRLYEGIAWTGILQWLDELGLFNFPPLFLMKEDDAQPRRKAIARLYSQPIPWKRAADELEGCNETFRQMQQNGHGDKIRQIFLSSSNHMPLGLVLAGHRQYSPTLFPKAVTEAFLEMHQEFHSGEEDENATGKLFLADQSDHWIHLQQPAVVVQAVEHVLQHQQAKGQ